MPCYAPNKIFWPKEVKLFVKQYYSKIPNTQILSQVAVMMGKEVKMSTLRHLMRKLGLIKGVRLIHWTPEQTAYLVDNYQTSGNIELAKKITAMKLSKRKFNKKHIEKKMVLLSLKRSQEQLNAIKNGHKEKGSYKGRINGAPEGNIVIWIYAGIPIPHIKINGNYVKQARIVYQQHFGPIPENHMVCYRDFDSLNLAPENLILKVIGNYSFNDKLKLHRIAKDNLLKLDQQKNRVKAPEYIRPTLTRGDQKIKVIINSRTTIYVKPGTDIEALKKKYDRPIVINESLKNAAYV